MRDFWLDDGFGCGWIATDAAGVVRDGCPLYRSRYRGRHLNNVIRRLRGAGKPVRWATLPPTPSTGGPID